MEMKELFSNNNKGTKEDLCVLTVVPLQQTYPFNLLTNIMDSCCQLG